MLAGRVFKEGTRYSYSGWYFGADDCDPPEPGKDWIAIEDEGEEMAVIVLRSGASIFQDDPERLRKTRAAKERDAETIVHALNFWYTNYKE